MRPLLLLAPPLAILAAAPPSFRMDLEEGRYLKTLADADARLKADSRDALAWAAKAHALSALLRLDEALAAAESALAIRPDLPEGLLARGLTRAAKGVQQRNLGSIRQVATAMDDLRAAAEGDPTLAQAWMSLGLGYQQLPGLLGGSTKKALRSADRLERFQPARGLALRGTILALEERWSEADPVLQRALQKGPGDAQVVAAYLDALGGRETRHALGEVEQKRRLAAEAARLLPAVADQARGVEAVSGALLDADRPEEAWSVALAGLLRSDTPSLLRLHLGKLAARAGIHREEGLAFLDQVLREPLEGGCGGPAAAHWRKGQILKDLGRLSEARAAAQSALKLDPRHPGARRLREDLVTAPR